MATHGRRNRSIARFGALGLSLTVVFFAGCGGSGSSAEAGQQLAAARAQIGKERAAARQAIAKEQQTADDELGGMRQRSQRNARS